MSIEEGLVERIEAVLADNRALREALVKAEAAYDVAANEARRLHAEMRKLQEERPSDG